MKQYLVFFLALAFPLTAHAQTPADNVEMSGIFDADQGARKPDFSKLTQADIGKILASDALRRNRTKALLDAGNLHTGTDFYHAAFVFQHGRTAADYLLAHSLAVAAAAKGYPEATWIAAATLDRYLQTIGQPQVYGTQFKSPNDGPTTQEPYDRALLSDQVRAVMGVPTLAKQQDRLAEIVKGRGK